MRRQQRPRARNKRLSSFRQRRQQHLLDVKVRSRKAVAHRNRRALVVFSKFALVIALIAGVYVGARFAAKRFFLDNPDYKLGTIEVQTDGTLQRDQILSVADLREGENIFRVHLARVHDRLQDLPQVDAVEVIRKLPGEIDIRIVERIRPFVIVDHIRAPHLTAQQEDDKVLQLVAAINRCAVAVHDVAIGVAEDMHSGILPSTRQGG